MSLQENTALPFAKGRQMAKLHLTILRVLRTAPIGQSVCRLYNSLFFAWSTT